MSDVDAEKLTLQYMRLGEELIYQGVISSIGEDVKFKGRPDFLKKCDGSSKFGDYHYIPVEIKNSTKCDKPEYKMQLMLYALILEKIQGYRPDVGNFINKNIEEIPCELTDKILKSTNSRISKILDILKGKEPTLKITKTALETPWADVLLAEAKQKSDISLLYKITDSVIFGLKQEGICKLSDMAACNIDSLPKIKGASIDTLRRLQQQANSLINDEIILISKPDIAEAQTKIYFDIESDTLLGVDYLFGFWIVNENSEPLFKYFLAEEPCDEEKMWLMFLDWLEDIKFENYKVYHYHIYEKTQLKKLSKKYKNSHQLSLFIDNLVDLSKILTDSFIFPVYFYSIKDIAKHLGFKWQHEKAGGAQSIFWYEAWLETNDKAILQDIINYNEDDVRATEFLHRWLIEWPRVQI